MISDDLETEEAFNFAFVDYFDLMRELSYDSVAWMDWRASHKNIINIDSQDDLISYVDAHIRFEYLESQWYNNFWDEEIP